MEGISELFCDTSFFYASLDKRDVDHEQAISIAQMIADHATVCYTTWDVISETLTLLRYRAGYEAAMVFVHDIIPTLEVVDYGEGLRNEALRVFEKYNQDHRLSSCDSISYVVVTRLLGHLPCAAFDDDFQSLDLQVIRI